MEMFENELREIAEMTFAVTGIDTVMWQIASVCIDYAGGEDDYEVAQGEWNFLTKDEDTEDYLSQLTEYNIVNANLYFAENNGGSTLFYETDRCGHLRMEFDLQFSQKNGDILKFRANVYFYDPIDSVDYTIQIDDIDAKWSEAAVLEILTWLKLKH